MPKISALTTVATPATTDQFILSQGSSSFKTTGIIPSDYKEGTYTCVAVPSSSGTITILESYDNPLYTKIGRVVMVQAQIVISSVSSPVGSNFTISLPFTSLAGVSNRSSVSIYFFDQSAGTRTVIPAYVQEASSSITIYFDASTVAAMDEFIFSCTYIS